MSSIKPSEPVSRVHINKEELGFKFRNFTGQLATLVGSIAWLHQNLHSLQKWQIAILSLGLSALVVFWTNAR